MNSTIPPYPAGVVAVPEPIERTAFFPGGLGLWMEEHRRVFTFPAGQTMVVGQDFNTLKTYNCVRKLKSELNASPTWRALRQVLGVFDIPVENCFFTNVYMGLRAIGPETGRFPGARDAAFIDRCIKFFNRQLAVARPKLILTLGLAPLRALGPPLSGIKRPKTLTACDSVFTLDLPHGRTSLVALTHPSMYKRNVVRRRFAQFAGIEAEKAMVRDARAAAGWRL